MTFAEKTSIVRVSSARTWSAQVAAYRVCIACRDKGRTAVKPVVWLPRWPNSIAICRFSLLCGLTLCCCHVNPIQITLKQPLMSYVKLSVPIERQSPASTCYGSNFRASDQKDEGIRDMWESTTIQQQRHNKSILSTHRFYQRLEKRAGNAWEWASLMTGGRIIVEDPYNDDWLPSPGSLPTHAAIIIDQSTTRYQSSAGADHSTLMLYGMVTDKVMVTLP